ncbi:hypothetical protein [Fibrobacter sp. UWB7]|uniref:hypothetical protein n=1 Tax=Fibrobacter sp. UWB7 TaxID=1896206 RepID=UPI0009342EDF|nr:hypothetical protein [Fibrobacter sp. UWB7]
MEKVKKFKKNVKKGDEWSVLGDKWNEFGWLFRRKELFFTAESNEIRFLVVGHWLLDIIAPLAPK